MRANTGEQLREINEALKQDQRNYLHEVMQGKARIAELEAELAALKEIPEQAEIAGYKASDGSLMSAESGALFSAKYIEQYEPLITVTHHNAIVSSLKAKAAVPDINQLIEVLERVRLSDEEAKRHGNGSTYWNNAVLACQIAIRDELAAVPAPPQSDAVQSNDGEVIELLAKLRQMVCATPQNDMDRSGVWISTNHPVIKRIDAMLGVDHDPAL